MIADLHDSELAGAVLPNVVGFTDGEVVGHLCPLGLHCWDHRRTIFGEQLLRFVGNGLLTGDAQDILGPAEGNEADTTRIGSVFGSP